MIDYLISDETNIWIKMELYFKNYEFSNFKRFSRKKLNFFQLKTLENGVYSAH